MLIQLNQMVQELGILLLQSMGDCRIFALDWSASAAVSEMEPVCTVVETLLRPEKTRFLVEWSIKIEVSARTTY